LFRINENDPRSVPTMDLMRRIQALSERLAAYFLRLEAVEQLAQATAQRLRSQRS
jgi:hypothetical protein